MQKLVSIEAAHDGAHVAHTGLRNVVIGTTAFLTVVDLFATQAILPTLARHYQVSPSAMGVAVNACTLGMAVSGLGVALLARKADRKNGILLSLALLSIPTALLAFAPGLATFTLLRVLQGIFMAAAFTLTLAYLGEECSAADAAGAFAAYITGNVASNLIGRLFSAALADHFNLACNFLVFAVLNLLGALLVHFTLHRTAVMPPALPMAQPETRAWLAHVRNGSLRAAFAIGFCILFAFIGTFTYVNFVLVRPPFSVGMMMLGIVYFVFVPSIVTTPLAGKVAVRIGTRPALWSAFTLALAGLPFLLADALSAVLSGLALIAVGTFFAQATATGFVGRAAATDRGAASGLYLASYFLGGLTGSAVLGILFDRLGWRACVAGIGLSLVLGALLSMRLVLPSPQPRLVGFRRV